MTQSKWTALTEYCREHFLEVILTLIVFGCSTLLTSLPAAKVAVLNLYFLPIVLAGFFLGRYRAGALALLSAITAGMLVSGDLQGFAASNSPVLVSLTLTVWAAVLGLTAIVVGTLKDDLVDKASEAREAQVGVVELLSRYLQSVNPQLENRCQRVARLCEQVALKLRLEPREIDNIRVAAVLADMENIEITARIVRKAVGELKSDGDQQRTVSGPELVRSLGEVLSGAFPLVAPSMSHVGVCENAPFGSRIIQVIRAYCRTQDETGDAPEYVIAEMMTDVGATYHPAVLHALSEVVGATAVFDTRRPRTREVVRQ